MILRVVCVALAAWLSCGAIAVTSVQPLAARYALAPSPWWLLLALIAAALLSRGLFILTPAAVLLLPWLPFRVPPAFLIWTGHLTAWLWVVLAAAVTLPRVYRHSPRALRAVAAAPGRAPWLAAAAAAGVYLVAAYQVSPQLPAGDEPHYLVITQSLLADHDLRIENNHRRGDYRAYYHAPLNPDYLRRGVDGEIYSIHAPGLPAIILPVFALFGYPGVVIFLAVVSAGATALAWIAAWRVTGDAGAAWFGWAAVALSLPFFVQSFMVYPDAPSGALIMLGVVTLLLGPEASRRRLALTGIALAVLPWLHTRAAIAAVALGVVLIIRQVGVAGWPRRVAALVVAPVASAIGWFAFFYVLYGTPDPRAPYGDAQQIALANVPRGVIGLLFDQQFGIVPNAPVYLCPAIGFVMLRRRCPRLAIELAAVIVPYGLAVAAFQMWWGGYSSPARFLVPGLLPLAIPAAVWFQASGGRASRVFGLGALAVSLLVTFTIVFVDRGVMLLNFRDGALRLLTWLSPLVDLTKGVPSLFQNGPAVALAQALVWLVAIGVTAWIGALVARRGASTERIAVMMGATAAALSMLALSTVWRSNRAMPITPTSGTMALLHRYDSDSRQIALRLAPFRRVAPKDLLARLTIVDATQVKDEPLVYLSHVPAAAYAIELALARATSGRVTATLDRTLGPAWTFSLDRANGVWRREIALPVAAPALTIDADPSVRAAVDRVVVRAVEVVGSAHRITGREPDHAARYGPALVFLIGGHAFMEPAGTWVAGGDAAEFAIVPDNHRPTHLLVRTPPIENRVTLEGDGWREELVLAPGESRVVGVPTVRVRVTSARGARPVDFEPGSTDARFLGCWIETR